MNQGPETKQKSQLPPQRHLAAISAVLHLLTLSASVASLYLASAPANARCFQSYLLSLAFCAYTFDIGVAVMSGRIYFYRWSIRGTLEHHIPFMFTGAVWSLATRNALLAAGNFQGISHGERAYQWAILSCANESSMALAAALGKDENRSFRMLSTAAGLVYFLVASPIWFLYATRMLSISLGTTPLPVILYTAPPVLYAVHTYPRYVVAYIRRWRRLLGAAFPSGERSHPQSDHHENPTTVRIRPP